MKLTVNQNVLIKDGDKVVECYVRRINTKTVSFNQRNPKLENGAVYSYRIQKNQLRKFVQES